MFTSRNIDAPFQKAEKDSTTLISPKLPVDAHVMVASSTSRQQREHTSQKAEHRKNHFICVTIEP